MPGKTYQVAFELAGKLNGSLNSSIMSVSGQLTSLHQKIKTLETAQGQVTRFAALKRELQTTGDSFQKAQLEVNRLSREIAQAQNPTKQLQNEFERAKQKAASLKQSISAQQTELHSLRSSLASAGVSTRTLSTDQAELSRRLQDTARSQNRLREAQGQWQASQQRLASARAGLFDAAASGAGIVLPVKQAIDFENAMLGVAKQVDGARDDSGQLTQVYYEMQQQVQQLGRHMPVVTNEIADMYTAGARMGVAKDELEGYTKTVAKMATAFEDIPAGELAEKMGKIAKVVGRPISEMEDLADTINYLDDNAISKGQDIIEVMLRIGGTAKQVGLVDHQAAALASTFLTLGKTPETAATAANALMRELAIATQQPKHFQEALAELGMTSQEVQHSMATDAQGTILRVLNALNGLDKEKQAVITTGLFGKEYGDDVATLSGSIDEYRRQLEMLNDEKRKGSMDREYQARLQTTTAQLQMAKNSAMEVAVAMGTVLLPGLKTLSGYFATAANSVANLAQAHPQLAAGVSTAAVAFLGAIVVLRTGIFLWSQYKVVADATRLGIELLTVSQKRSAVVMAVTSTATRAMSVAQWALNAAMFVGRGLFSVARIIVFYSAMAAGKLVIAAATFAQWAFNGAMLIGRGLFSAGRVALYFAAMSAGRAVLAVMAAGQWALNVAMMANPVGLVIAGIFALVAAGYLLYQNWDTVKAFFITLWNDPLAAIASFVSGLQALFAPALQWLEDKWNYIKSLFSSGLSTSVNVSGDPGNMAGHADGGIFVKEHIARFAEGGKAEAAIPLTNPSRGIPLWLQAGQMMGLVPKRAIATAAAAKSDSGNGASFIYSPIIYAGNATTQELKPILDADKDNFEKQADAFWARKRRLSFA